MPQTNTSLVDIVREFLEAQALLHDLAARFRRDELTFPQLQSFVGDNEGSVLFRLKEKCHALFRSEVAGPSATRVREALFDLAVGSLFHEAMKFREDFYQREVYGPRVRQLRADAESDAAGLFIRFERILSAVSDRLEVGFAETTSLMDQSWAQLRVLLAAQPDPGLVTRFLIERRQTIDELASPGLDALLAEIHRDPARGYEIAARSYLNSGHYPAAVAAFDEAMRRSQISEEGRHLPFFARGMAAYLEGDYSECVAGLRDWVAAGCTTASQLTLIARAALSSLDHLVDGPDRDEVLKVTSMLLAQIPAVAA